MTRSMVDPGVHVPDAPAIPGLRFRTYAGEADLTAMAAVHNAARLADDYDLVITADGLGTELEHMPNADPFRDVLLAEVDGRLVGVSSRWWAMRDGIGSFEHDGSVLPEFRGRGIGRAMLRAHEAALRTYASAGPADTATAVFSSWTPDSASPTVQLLTTEGYRPARFFFEMARPTAGDLPVVEMPTGLVVRPVTGEDVRRAVRAENEAFRDHWGHRDLGESDIDGIIGHPDFDASLMVVAWDGDEIAGVVTNAIFAAENEALGLQRGWLERVSVRRPWRRRGVAKALIAESLRMLRDRGMTIGALGVDADNPSGALGLYEGLGFVTIHRATTYRKPLESGAPSTDEHRAQ